MLNGWTASVPGQNPRGWMAQGGYAMEDLNVDHNTVYDNRGALPRSCTGLTIRVAA